MVWKSIYCVAVVGLLVGTAQAAPFASGVVFDPNRSEATAGLSLSGGLELSVSGQAYYKVFGFPVAIPGTGFDLPLISWEDSWGESTKISNPTGTANVAFDYPSLSGGTIDDLNIDIKGDADWSVDASFDWSETLIGPLFGIGSDILTVDFAVGGGAGITAFTWEMDASDTANGVIDPNGTLSASIGGSFDADLMLSFLPGSPLGQEIDVFDLLGFDPNFGFDGSLFELDTQLLGDLTLTDIGGFDVDVEVDGDLPDFSPAGFDFGSAESFEFNLGDLIPGFDNAYYEIDLTYNVYGGLDIDAPAVDLVGTVTVPEPASLLIVSAGGLLMGLRRRRC